VVADVTQKSAESIGNSFKTIYARIQQVKLGALVDADGESISNVDKVLQEYGITLRDTVTGEFRDTGTVLDELAVKWNTLASTEKNEIAGTIAGVRQKENFLVLMQNYDKALKLEEVSLNSAGSAQEKFNVYQDSATAATERLTSEFQKLFMAVDSKGLKALINLATGILKTINAIGGLNTILLLTISILMLWKGEAIISFFAGLPRLVMTAVTALRTFGTTAATLQSTLGVIGLVLTAISIGYGLITEAIEANNQAMEEGLSTYQSQIQSLTDLKTKLDETVAGAGTESEKREALLELIKGMNSEYETEATNLKTVNDLRDLATKKIEEEASAAAKEFQAKSGDKYVEAKQFIEEPGAVLPGTGSGGVPDVIRYTSVIKEISRLETVLSDLVQKRIEGIKLSTEEEETLKRSQGAYDKLSQKYEELLPYYEAGNAALDILNGTTREGSDDISDLTTETDKLLATMQSAVPSAEDQEKSFNDLAKAIDPLDSALIKLAKDESLTAREVFSLIDQYPELIDSLKLGANGYYLEASAIDTARNAVITKKQEDIKSAFASADAVLKSSGIIVNSYSSEISAIESRISAQIALKNVNMKTAFSPSERYSMANMDKYWNGTKSKALEASLKAVQAIKDLKKQQSLLNTFTSSQDISATKRVTAYKVAEEAARDAEEARTKAERAAQEAQKEAERIAEEAQKNAENRLKAQIDIRMATLDAEKKAIEDAAEAAQKAADKIEENLKTKIELEMSAFDSEKKVTEDSFDQQIDALDKVNDARQDEIDLIKEKEALLHAQTNKRMVYREGMGFVAESDAEAIAEAEQKLANRALEKQRKTLETQKESALVAEDLKKTEHRQKLLQEMQATNNPGIRAVYASALDLTEFNGAWYDSKGEKVFEGNGTIVDKDLKTQKENALATEDLKKTEYERQLLRDMQATNNEGLRSVYASVLGMTKLDGHWYDSNGKMAFRDGGINDYTGLAMLHGKPNQNEVIFNSSQAAALFNWVQGLTNPSITRTPTITKGSDQTINIETINLPSVKNGMDFITELQLIAKNR
jgi:hypothetical protein